jgi:hypothetical protein
LRIRVQCLWIVKSSPACPVVEKTVIIVGAA